MTIIEKLCDILKKFKFEVKEVTESKIRFDMAEGHYHGEIYVSSKGAINMSSDVPIKMCRRIFETLQEYA